ncbi:uncharacterized protein LOC126898277 [Daktulosphaira vitifoliae]|uniref:uncharacterized protein LOC126898277 n=1 Tax=Daktulosphaira vitifoliae TaxID=58002 RepID=UPI0021A9B56D|nr:uncharacterized protein LOC126898277 [Daktulosphaira vitifoliae]
MNIIKEKKWIDEKLQSLLEICTKTTVFTYQDTIYEQTDGMAMGSRLAPVFANIFMEWFEAEAMSTYTQKPKMWLRYVDDTFVLWQHGEDKLQSFLQHLNSIHANIQFTMETEENGKLPFLDVMVKKQPNGKFGTGVYRKSTHTDRYLHADSHHCPSQKMGLLHTMATRAVRIADENHVNEEKTYLRQALKNNGYTIKNINKAIKKAEKRKNATRIMDDENNEDEKKGTLILPYIQGITDRISRIAQKFKLRTVFKPNTVAGSLLRNPKDKLPEMQTPGVYEIPCSCGKSYIGQTGRAIATRIKEHEKDVEYQRTEKSAVAEHAKNKGHDIQFDKVKILNKEPHFGKRMYKEAIEIEKCPENFNREDGWKISKTWLPIIHQTKRKLTNNTETNSIYEEATINITNNCRCRKGRPKCQECRKQR